MRNVCLIGVFIGLLVMNSYGQLVVRNSADEIKMTVIQNGNVGIGTASDPVAKLEVNGRTKTLTIQVTGGSPGAGKVLTSDVDGLGHWATPAADTDDQTLSWNNGTRTLSIVDGNSVNIPDATASFLVNQMANFEPNPTPLLDATLIPLGNTEITITTAGTYMIIGTVDLEVTYATAGGVLQRYTGGAWSSITGSIILANANTVNFVRSTCTRTWVLNLLSGDKVRLAAHNVYSSGTAQVWRVHSGITVFSLF